MIRDKSIISKAFDGFNIFIMLIIIIVTLYPFLYIIFASLSRPELLKGYENIIYKPVGFTTAAYQAVFRNDALIRGFRNTLIYLTFGTMLNIIMTSLGAYVVSRKGYLLRKLFSIYLIIPMFFGGGLIPSYLVALQLGLVNNPLAMIIPGAINMYNLIILRTAFSSVPESLPESARIDGAKEITLLFRIVIPVCIPTLAVITLYYSVAHWNSWFQAAIYLRDRTLFPMQLILREILIMGDMNDMLDLGSSDLLGAAIRETTKYAAIIVTTIPVLFIYPFLQKYFIKGVMIGAIKE